MNISEIVDQGRQFREELRLVKRQIGAVGFEWYPYDTLSSLVHLERMLTGPNRQLLAGKPLRILDVGCQDGELSFLLERLGHEVVAIDHPVYNHNGMQGVKALREALGSAVQLHEMDIDRQFTLPHDSYDLVLVLGVLYHVRNPFYLLEELARRASYCLMSTRVARRFPGGAEMPEGVALAYLLHDRELNDDETNYFIFSEPGLRVMAERAYWEICDYATVGQSENSEPVRLDRDERAFCLLKSRYDRLADLELLTGWHAAEQTGWRWTERSFSARARWAGAIAPKTVAVDLYLADNVLRNANPLRLSLAINGEAVTPEVCRNAGRHTMVRRLGKNYVNQILFEFELNGALPPDEQDSRERGVIVESIRIE
jgi:tRNA (mo5U34)-methyltransferase